MKVQALFCIAVLALFGSIAQAQDSQESQDSQGSQESQGLITALEGSRTATLRGSVEISKADADVPAKQGGQNIPGLGRVQIQVMGGGSGGGKSAFTGDLEIFIADGAISATTTSGLPQFKVYSKGSQKLVSQIYSKSPKSIGKTADLLALAFDFDSLIEEIKEAKLVRAKDTENGKQFRVTLGAEAFEIEEAAGDARAQVARMTQQSVLEGVLTVDTDSSGELAKLNLELQYNNPMAGLLKMGGAGGGAMQLNLGQMKKSAELGPKLNIAFTPDAEQGETAEAFAKEAAEILSAEGE